MQGHCLPVCLVNNNTVDLAAQEQSGASHNTCAPSLAQEGSIWGCLLMMFGGALENECVCYVQPPCPWPNLSAFLSLSSNCGNVLQSPSYACMSDPSQQSNDTR
jgi:hypothetical protein